MSKDDFVVFALIAAAVFALYGFSLGNDFVHDDEGQIVENPYIKSLDYLPKAFTSCIWEAYADGCKGRTNYYRPLHSASYLFTNFVSKSAAFFHFINLFYYILLCLVVYLLSRKILANKAAAYVSTAIFLIHPIHTEAVLWIASVPELLYGLFAILAMLLHVSYAKYREWSVPALFLLALLAKEPAVFIPVVMLVYDALRGIRGNQGESGGAKRGIVLYLFSYWRYALAFGVYFAMRTLAIGGLGTRTDFYEFSFLERIYSSIFVFGEYIKKTVWPMELNPFIPFEPISSAAYPSFLLNAALVILFLSALAWAIYKRNSVIAFGLLVYALFLSPVIVFVNSVAENVIAERYLLLPSFGAVIILGYFVSRVLEKKYEMLKYAAIAVTVVFIGYSVPKVYAQNSVWRSSQSLYEYAYNHNARKGTLIDVTSTYDLAVLYEKDGRIDEAKEFYFKIIYSGDKKKNIPSVAKALNNLGAIYIGEKDYDRAVEYFEKSLLANPKHERALSNLGTAYVNKDMRVLAIESFIKALKINQDSQTAGNNIRVLYGQVIDMPSYDKSGNPAERYLLISELLNSQVWRSWRYEDTYYEVKEALASGEGVKMKIVLKPQIVFNFPITLFYELDGKLYFNPHIQGVFNADSGELSLTARHTPDKIYIMLEDFKYYEISKI